MHSAAFIQKLKQTNVSADAQKTKERLSAIWKAATTEQQNEIMLLTGVARSTIERAYRTGSVSAKLIVPIAESLGVNAPFLTGESDTQEFDETALEDFLLKHGYGAMSGDAKVRGTKKKKRAPINMEHAHIADTVPPPAHFIDAMTEDEMVLLLRASILRARAGGREAARLTEIKKLLLL